MGSNFREAPGTDTALPRSQKTHEGLPCAMNELDRLYARIPKLECKRLCQQSCGPIVMSRLEWDRIKERRKDLPMFASAENRRTLTCPYLDEAHGSCSVY